jgi:adenylyltransferase/sulfurtransferase
VSAAVTEFEGQLATYKAYQSDCPCYRCLFPAPPEPGTIPNCSQTGVLGAAAGVMGSLQALEVLKEAAGLGTGLAGKILVYKALTGEFRTLRLAKDPACPLCGKKPTISDLSGHG